MRAIEHRLHRLEQHASPAGGLPVILIAADGPAGEQARQQAQHLRQQGRQVVLVADEAQALPALVDLCL